MIKRDGILAKGKKIIFFMFMTITFLNANSYDSGMNFFVKGQFKKALPYLTKASNSGNKQAQFYLANMYEKGLGVKKDLKMAKKLYQLYSGKPKPVSVVKVTKKTKSNSIKRKKVDTTKKYSKRLKKHYNSDINAASETTFD